MNKADIERIAQSMHYNLYCSVHMSYSFKTQKHRMVYYAHVTYGHPQQRIYLGSLAKLMQMSEASLIALITSKIAKMNH